MASAARRRIRASASLKNGTRSGRGGATTGGAFFPRAGGAGGATGGGGSRSIRSSSRRRIDAIFSWAVGPAGFGGVGGALAHAGHRDTEATETISLRVTETQKRATRTRRFAAPRRAQGLCRSVALWRSFISSGNRDRSRVHDGVALGGTRDPVVDNRDAKAGARRDGDRAVSRDLYRRID